MHKSVWWLFLLMSMLAMIELASILAITGYFAVMNHPEIVSESVLGKKIIEYFPSVADLIVDHKVFVLWSCTIPIGLIVIKNIISSVVAWRSSMLGEKVSAYIGSSIMERFLYMPYVWHLSAESSEALTCMQWRFNLGKMLLHILIVYSNLITVILLFLGLFLYEPGITVCSIIVMTATSIITYGLIRKHISAASHQAAQAQHNENKATVIALNGVREVQIFQQQPIFLEAIRKHVHAGMGSRTFLGICSTIPTWTLESMGFILIWFTVFIMVKINDASILEITTAVALLALTAWRVLPSLNRVVGSTMTICSLQSTALPCLEYFEKLQTAVPEHITINDAGPIKYKNIMLDNVSFRYPGASNNILTNITLTISKGTTVGLIGRSGTGKSTFLNILSGLLEPTEGHLLLDDKKMTKEELSAYRKQVGYVPQNPYMLKASVAENVAFKDWGKPVDKEKVLRCCRRAGIDFLGENCSDFQRNASSLSGGQAQRVAIARALYTEPTLLIFDEATSALDQFNEALVLETIANNKGKQTCVIATHRLQTLNICDFVIWIENGEIKLSGKPDIVLNEYKSSDILYKQDI